MSYYKNSLTENYDVALENSWEMMLRYMLEPWFLFNWMIFYWNQQATHKDKCINSFIFVCILSILWCIFLIYFFRSRREARHGDRDAPAVPPLPPPPMHPPQSPAVTPSGDNNVTSVGGGNKNSNKENDSPLPKYKRDLVHKMKVSQTPLSLCLKL